MTEFHRNVAVPFLNALLDEIEAPFDMSSIEPAEALLVLDPVKIPVVTNQNHPQFGVKKLSVYTISMATYLKILTNNAPLKAQHL